MVITGMLQLLEKMKKKTWMTIFVEKLFLHQRRK